MHDVTSDKVCILLRMKVWSDYDGMCELKENFGDTRRAPRPRYASGSAGKRPRSRCTFLKCMYLSLNYGAGKGKGRKVGGWCGLRGARLTPELFVVMHHTPLEGLPADLASNRPS